MTTPSPEHDAAAGLEKLSFKQFFRFFVFYIFRFFMFLGF